MPKLKQFTKENSRFDLHRLFLYHFGFLTPSQIPNLMPMPTCDGLLSELKQLDEISRLDIWFLIL
jgi:hypothetical protein